jgi:hypothetical protein
MLLLKSTKNHLLLESGDDLTDQASLDAVRLDHDVGLLSGHFD